MAADSSPTVHVDAPHELTTPHRWCTVAAAEFVTMSLVPLGLQVLCVSRAPYLSGGDAQAPLYSLDDLIVVCRARESIPLIGGAPR